MFLTINYSLLCFTVAVIHLVTSTVEPTQTLTLYSQDDVEYTDIIVKRVSDSLELVCELRGTQQPRRHVWNYVPADNVLGHTPYTTDPDPSTPTINSKLLKHNLTVSDSGHYMCSAPPFSLTKYILVQENGPSHCTKNSFWCGQYCILPAYLCDGRRDCQKGEDEDPVLCDLPCQRPDRLNCSDGRCIPSSWCCPEQNPLCKQPTCCNEHRPTFGLGPDIDYPPLFEDRHAPDEYGFIQSTIYTVTACALIFMIAVVLLVSAVCKMHMKRCALRARRPYLAHLAHPGPDQSHRFPPCYEASRLLEQDRRIGSPSHTPHTSPIRQALQCSSECPPDSPTESHNERDSNFGLARLTSIFSQRYRQVPTQCLDVELTDVRPSSVQSSPTRTRTQLDHYRSPTYCDLNSELFFNPEISDCGRDLNYMATPLEFCRRNMREGVFRQERPLTLQLGRFQLSIPRLGRRRSLERRPDTPNIAELNIDDLDFVRLNSNETYTLNGRTIRLLGGNFENYPILNDTVTRPPPYNEAMRYKIYGPPPEYLSRDALNNDRIPANTVTEEQATNNVEMPPNYEELASCVDGNANVNGEIRSNNNRNDTVINVANNVIDNTVLNNVIIDTNNVISNVANNDVSNVSESVTSTVINNVSEALASNVINGSNNTNNVTNNDTSTLQTDISNTQSELPNNNTPLSTLPCNLSSVIDNLPPIDSDVNANEEIDRNVCVNNNGY